jgi:hypothetical protein
MTGKRLRIQAVSIHVALAWDDGEELTPGPGIDPVTLPLSQARQMLEGLSTEVAHLEKQIREQDASDTVGV